jgi:hypothetical protein
MINPKNKHEPLLQLTINPKTKHEPHLQLTINPNRYESLLHRTICHKTDEDNDDD